MAIDPQNIRIYEGTGEWSALYVNGLLEYVGDHYNVQEHLIQLLGIHYEQSDDFLMGGDQRDDVATTVAALEVYRETRVAREEEAYALRQQAKYLMQRAAELDAQ